MIRKKISTAYVVLFMFVAVTAITFSMPMDHHGMMINCPFMEHMNTMCPMTPLTHLSAWQEMFRAALPQNGMIFLLFIFLAPVLFIFWRKMERARALDSPQSLAFRNFHRDKGAEIQLGDFFLKTLAFGWKIHPKIYA